MSSEVFLSIAIIGLIIIAAYFTGKCYHKDNFAHAASAEGVTGSMKPFDPATEIGDFAVPVTHMKTEDLTSLDDVDFRKSWKLMSLAKHGVDEGLATSTEKHGGDSYVGVLNDSGGPPGRDRGQVSKIERELLIQSRLGQPANIPMRPQYAWPIDLEMTDVRGAYRKNRLHHPRETPEDLLVEERHHILEDLEKRTIQSHNLEQPLRHRGHQPADIGIRERA